MRKLGWSALLFVGTIAAAQPRTNETIEVSIVNLDVVVTDKDGKRVTGLTANDFEVREGGKLQPITNFTEYEPGMKSVAAGIEEAPGTGEAAAVPRPPRTVVVFVEAARLKPADAKRMFDSLRQLMLQTVAPGDRATIVSWHRAVLVRQPFTDNVAQLVATLDELEKEQVEGPRDLSEQVRREQNESDSDAAAMAAAGGLSTGGMPSVHLLDAARRERAEIRQKAHVLEALMNSISGLEGRKIMIMAMKRFGRFAGADYFGGQVPPEERSQLSTEAVRDALIRTANANNITLYPVYAPGLRWTGPDAAAGGDDSSAANDLAKGALDPNQLLNETMSLDDLAKGTGGLMAWGAGNIAEMLPRVAEDLEAYYSLAYRVSSTGKDVTRKIEVRAKNPQYQVRTRTQFVEKSDETEMKDRLIANLYQRLGNSTLPFDVLLGDLKSLGRKRWQLPLKVRIPIGALTTLPQGAHDVGEFSVYVVTGAVVGVMSEVQHRSQPFRIPRADLARAKSSHFTYDLTLEIDERVDRLSIGVVDETAREFGLKRIAVPSRTMAAASQPQK